MKFRVKPELCRGCGVCEAVCSNVYQMESRVAKVIVESVNDDLKNCAIEGENICPVGAIIHE